MWEQIRSNRRKAALLVVCMAGLLFVLGWVGAEAVHPGAGPVGLAIAFIVWCVMSLTGYFGGDDIMLAVSGAQRIEKEDHPRLYNIVDEMRIASGLGSMPAIYIVDDPSPNAFATGRAPDRAAVAVTTGLLNLCTRDELQGVIAHELAHVKNRDVLLMIMLGVMVGSIVMLSDAMLRVFFYGGVGGGRRRSRTSREEGQAQLVLIVIALVLAILAPLLAQVIYMAVSRQREYLADACSAQFTRYPEGLASALEKISGHLQPPANANRVTAPMYIVNPLRGGRLNAHSLTATHPPVEERIRILRSMAGGAGFVAYETAFQKVTGKTGLIPPSALAQGGSVPIREKSVEPGAEPAGDRRLRTRETTDALWRSRKYRFIDCACGVRLKVPPEFSGSKIRCPKCGAVHSLAEAA